MLVSCYGIEVFGGLCRNAAGVYPNIFVDAKSKRNVRIQVQFTTDSV